MQLKVSNPPSIKAATTGRSKGPMRTIIAFIAALGLGAAGVYVFKDQLGIAGKPAPVKDAKAEATFEWIAAAPGRVEPKSGEIRLGTSVLGRVAEVLVKVDNEVEEGELLVRLDDEEARARLAAAEAEALARRKDQKDVLSSREEVRDAEDNVYAAERGVTGARFELDYAIAAKRAGTGSAQDLANARKRLKDAEERLRRDRLAYVKAQSKPGLASPNRAEAVVSAGRADVTIAEALLEKTRIRASSAGRVLETKTKAGEIVAPSPDRPLVVIGDMSVVRVKAEVDESDVSKVKLGQKAFVRSISYPGRDFAGTVSKLAPSLSAPEIGPRGPRRQTDVDVLEVTIDLDGDVPLLPGMRVDAFFR